MEPVIVGDWMSIVSMVLNALLFSGLIVTLLTLRATKRKANAEAKRAVAEAVTTELQNVESAIKIWRDLADAMCQKYEIILEQNKAISDEVEQLRKQVSRLAVINNKIVKLLDKITPENLESMIEKIKQEVRDEIH